MGAAPFSMGHSRDTRLRWNEKEEERETARGGASVRTGRLLERDRWGLDTRWPWVDNGRSREKTAVMPGEAWVRVRGQDCRQRYDHVGPLKQNKEFTFFFPPMRNEMSLVILEQGSNIICFGGKFKFLNSIRKMLVKPCTSPFLPQPRACAVLLSPVHDELQQRSFQVRREAGQGGMQSFTGFRKIWIKKRNDETNFRGTTLFPYPTSHKGKEVSVSLIIHDFTI